MFLKVYPPSKPPFAVTLGEGEYFMGTAETNDIVVGDTSVSRKHLKIICEGDEFYIADQGSTNGTFRDKTQLVPGEREKIEEEEFYRLGNGTYIILVEEADAEVVPPKPVKAKVEARVTESDTSSQDKTRVVNLKEIMAPVPSRPKVTKSSAKAKAKKPADPKAKSLHKSMILAVVIIVLGWFINRAFIKERPNIQNKMMQGIKVDRVAPNAGE